MVAYICLLCYLLESYIILVSLVKIVTSVIIDSASHSCELDRLIIYIVIVKLVLVKVKGGIYCLLVF